MIQVFTGCLSVFLHECNELFYLTRFPLKYQQKEKYFSELVLPQAKEKYFEDKADAIPFYE